MIRIAGEGNTRSMRPQRDAVECLRDRVVQLPRQLLPLLQRRQVLRLSIEPRILNGDGGLVGDCQGKISVM